jgi:integration host factor subunit beta
MSGEDPLTITKKELVHRIADETRQTKVVVKDVIQRFLDEIVNELVAGNRLEFREFGVFEIRQRASRLAQNPRTLEKVEVPAKRVVKFKAGRLMRQKIGGGSDEGPEDFDEDDDDSPSRSAAKSTRAAGAPSSLGRGPAKPRSSPGDGTRDDVSKRAAGFAPPPAPPKAPPKPPSNSPF